MARALNIRQFPNVTGGTRTLILGSGDPSGAFYSSVTGKKTGSPTSGNENDWGITIIDASRVNGVYGASNTVQVAASQLLMIIKS